MNSIPKHLRPPRFDLSIGSELGRSPTETMYSRVQGTYPMKTRPVTSVERVSEHKVIVHLGMAREWDSGMFRIPSTTAIIAIYGEIDDKCIFDDELMDSIFNQEVRNDSSSNKVPVDRHGFKQI